MLLLKLLLYGLAIRNRRGTATPGQKLQNLKYTDNPTPLFRKHYNAICIQNLILTRPLTMIN
jgi:hypothetical protein